MFVKNTSEIIYIVSCVNVKRKKFRRNVLIIRPVGQYKSVFVTGWVPVGQGATQTLYIYNVIFVTLGY